MSVGQALRQARLERNITIAEVAAAIRVRASIVADIEEDKFEACGGEVYGRGHQRIYAKYLNLNIEDQLFSNTPIVETNFEPKNISPTVLKPIGARPNWSVVLGAGSVVSIALLAVILIGNNEGILEQNPVTAPAETEIAANQPTTDSTTTSPTTNGDLTASATDEVLVGINVVSDSCWLRVEDSSGEVVFQGVLRLGDQQTFSDPTQLSLVLGNAGGVNFTLNGVDLGTPGTLGQVLRLTVLPGQTTITP